MSRNPADLPAVSRSFSRGFDAIRAQPGLVLLATVAVVPAASLLFLGTRSEGTVRIWLQVAAVVVGSAASLPLGRAALAVVDGHRLSMAEAFRTGGSFATAVGTGLLFTLVLTAGLYLLLLPGIWVVLTYGFAWLSVADGAWRPLEALSRAGRIATGNRWTLCVFLLGAVAVVAAGAVLLGIGALVGFSIVAVGAADLYRALGGGR